MNDNRLKRKWTPSEKAADTTNIQNGWPSTVYWKNIISPNGSIIARVCGITPEEAESLAGYICKIHNGTLTAPATDTGE